MNNVEKIWNELKYSKIIDKQEFFNQCVQQRLNKSLIEYHKSIQKAFDSLINYNIDYDVRLMKKLNKE